MADRRSGVIRRLSVLALVVTGVVAFSTSTAAAKTRPTLRVSVPAQSDSGAKIPYTWRGSGLPTHTRLVLQRPVGTANVWKTFQTLRSHSGGGTIAPFGLGVWQLRLAAVSKTGQLLAQKPFVLRVFGNISLLQLLDSSGYMSPAGTYSETTPTATFPYTFALDAGSPDTTTTAFEIEPDHNACRSVTLSFLLGEATDFDYDGGIYQGGTLTVVQQSALAASATAAWQQPGTLTVALHPSQSWALNASYAQTQGTGYAPSFFISGTASCDSAASADPVDVSTS